MRSANCKAAGLLALLAPLLGTPTAHAATDPWHRSDAEIDRLAEHIARTHRTTFTHFEAALDAQPSATAALEGWCAQQHLTLEPHAKITAHRIFMTSEPAPPPQVRRLLGADTGETIATRHVELWCGTTTTLSVATNWYLPVRLTPAMNATLATSDAPFGKVVAPLHFSRDALSSQRGRAEGCPAGTILSRRALLRLPDSHPLALLVECYTRTNLAPPPLRPLIPEPVPVPVDVPHRAPARTVYGGAFAPPSQAPSPTLP